MTRTYYRIIDDEGDEAADRVDLAYYDHRGRETTYNSADGGRTWGKWCQRACALSPVVGLQEMTLRIELDALRRGLQGANA